MPRHSDDPLQHIVTFRVTSDEKKLLERLAKQAGCTLSDFMRHSLTLIGQEEPLGQ